MSDSLLSVGVLHVYLMLSRASTFMDSTIAKHRLAKGKEHQTRYTERLGLPSKLRPNGKLVWFHSASVGESTSILRLINRMHKLLPDVNFLITTGTVSSAIVLSRMMPPKTIHQFVPYDVLPNVRKFLNHWKPTIGIWIESEFWPALIYESNHRDIPLILLNARISSTSFKRWKRWRGVAALLLKKFDLIHAQSDQIANYLIELDYPEDRIQVTGSLKQGAEVLACSEVELSKFRACLGNRPVWLAASTHQGEEAIVSEAHRMVLQHIKNALLIVVPRHPERKTEILDVLNKDWESIPVRSENGMPTSTDRVYLADTLGEMGLWYRVASISFIGGSLVASGGHNPFEPAMLKSAIIHGCHIHNFAESYDMFTRANASISVNTTQGLVDAVRFLSRPENHERFTTSAISISTDSGNATDAAVKLLMAKLTC